MKIDFSITAKDAQGLIEKAKPKRVFAFLPKKVGESHWRWLEFVWRSHRGLRDMENEFARGDYDEVFYYWRTRKYSYESIE